ISEENSGEGSMILLGTIVNVISIIIGSIVGMFLTKIPEKYKETIMQGVALTVILIGLQMAFETDSIIILLSSILFGAIIGEFLRLELALDRFGQWIANKFTNQKEDINVAQAFVTASLIFVVGAMAILGSLDSGLRGDHEILYTKSILDGFSSFVLTTTLGIGVILSAIPVALFQGTITLLASKIESIITATLFDTILAEITAVGGLLILAIGLNLLKLTKIRVTNLLPSLIVVVVLLYFQTFM